MPSRKAKPKVTPQASTPAPRAKAKSVDPLHAAAWAVIRQQRMLHIWRTAGRECDCRTCLVVRALRDELVRQKIKDPEEKP